MKLPSYKILLIELIRYDSPEFFRNMIVVFPSLIFYAVDIALLPTAFAAHIDQ
jgi:hypothetical protein